MSCSAPRLVLVRVTAAFLLLAGCGDDGDSSPATPPDAGDEVGGADTGAPPDTGPAEDEGEPPQQVCEPGERLCTQPWKVDECWSDGLGSSIVEECEYGTYCEPEAAACVPWECTPLETVCVDGGRSVAACTVNGELPEESALCEGNTWCFDTEGCVPVDCQPGTVACTADGGLGTCDGYVYEPLKPGCDRPSCVQCPSDNEIIICDNPGTDGAGDIASCGPESRCFATLGCLPTTCEPGEERCVGDTIVAQCDGTGEQWEPVYCLEDEVCVPLTDTLADCQIDCGQSGECKLELCTPLPPFLSDNSTPWVPPADPTTLSVTFNIGLSTDFKVAFLNISPIINPLTGEFLLGLEPVDPDNPEAGGNITIREDGVAMKSVCVPLTISEYVTLDLVFVIDVTGSMSSSIDKVKDSAIELAFFLGSAGHDVQFGVVPYRDDVDGNIWALSPSVQDFTEFVSGLSASGGGDGPENGLDGIVTAIETMAWRPGSQRAIVLITDNSLHQQGDGSTYTEEDLVSVLEKLLPDHVVHTVSPDQGDSPVINGKFGDPRALSCATGGTSAELDTFLAEDINVSPFAQALKQSYHCQYFTEDPISPHDVEVEVIYDYEGTTLFGQSKKTGVTYVTAE